MKIDNRAVKVATQEEDRALLKLIEECSEVQHVCCKIMKFGWDFVPNTRYPNKPLALLKEINDLRGALADVDIHLAPRLKQGNE